VLQSVRQTVGFERPAHRLQLGGHPRERLTLGCGEGAAPQGGAGMVEEWIDLRGEPVQPPVRAPDLEQVIDVPDAFQLHRGPGRGTDAPGPG